MKNENVLLEPSCGSLVKKSEVIPPKYINKDYLLTFILNKKLMEMH